MEVEVVNGGLVNSLSNEKYIKKVTKPYLLGYTATTANTDAADWLWLLSCSEIWNRGRDGQPYGYAKAKEGERYKFYQMKNPDGSSTGTNTWLQKGPKGGSTDYWCLRSPYYSSKDYFCRVNPIGCVLPTYAGDTNGVAPGFCI